MGRMLDALRQIESHQRWSPVPPQEEASEVREVEPAGVSCEAAADAAVVRESASREDGDPVRDSSAMEVLLVEAEAAAAEALEESTVEWAAAGAEFEGSSDPDRGISGAGVPSCPVRRTCVEEEEGLLADPLGDLAGTVLRAMAPGQPACFLFTSPDSDNLGADLLVPLSMSLVRRLEGNLLLIDTNLRRPVLASRLGVEASRGLTDVLSGAADWQEVVRRTVLPRVDLLPAVPFSTPAGPRPSRLNLDRLLAEARDHYRLVLIHASSLQCPEVAPMARHCEGVYLVVRLHSTARRAAREAVPLLRCAGGNVLGCVVVQ
ncbi:MAG: hypothetical protein RBS80_17975 [Thermoguttaceae bacterium]|jgi:Mrp family chromosome partitioning ATPase|nr:hypothetical protein [Thermoguttaceae bacterium]